MNEKQLKEAVFQSELFLPTRFSTVKKYEWGNLYYNQSNPLSFEANQGIILSKNAVDEHLKEISEFYGNLDLKPRAIAFDSFGIDGVKGTKRKCMIHKNHPKEIFLSRRKGEISEEKVFTKEMAENIFCGTPDDYLSKVISESLNSEEFHLLVLRMLDMPVSMACVKETPFGVTCISDVITSLGFRGCLFASELIRYAVDFAHGLSDDTIYLFTSNETALNLYKNSGFEIFETPIDTVYRFL